jgi:hypothetical protein
MAREERDDAWFRHEVLPKLDSFSLEELATATGLSLVACSRIRSGARIPHPRHWEALSGLVERRGDSERLPPPTANL